MKNKELKYYKCWKCGGEVKSKDNLINIPCINLMAGRTSGICGGSYTEITEKEYKNG